MKKKKKKEKMSFRTTLADEEKLVPGLTFFFILHINIYIG